MASWGDVLDKVIASNSLDATFSVSSENEEHSRVKARITWFMESDSINNSVLKEVYRGCSSDEALDSIDKFFQEEI